MTKQRVLVLDDNEAILDVIAEALIYENFDVLSLRLGYGFFRIVRDYNPHLILLDYQMADINGGDICKQLKSDEMYWHIPVVVFSAYFDPGDKPVDISCDGFLYKPFALHELLNAIHRHLPAGSITNAGPPVAAENKHRGGLWNE